jgi:hypothetical protein
MDQDGNDADATPAAQVAWLTSWTYCGSVSLCHHASSEQRWVASAGRMVLVVTPATQGPIVLGRISIESRSSARATMPRCSACEREPSACVASSSCGSHLKRWSRSVARAACGGPVYPPSPHASFGWSCDAHGRVLRVLLGRSGGAYHPHPLMKPAPSRRRGRIGHWTLPPTAAKPRSPP